MSTAAYCRTAGIPAISYGWDVAASLTLPFARAATPDTYVRSVDLVSHFLDATGVCLDPAMEAYAPPIVRCLVGAVCRPPARAHLVATDRLARGGDCLWQQVAGHVAATVASAWRLNWRFPSARRLFDDSGTEWDLLRHSPATLQAAVERSVKHWRMRKICADLPTLANRGRRFTMTSTLAWWVALSSTLVTCSGGCFTARAVPTHTSRRGMRHADTGWRQGLLAANVRRFAAPLFPVVRPIADANFVSERMARLSIVDDVLRLFPLTDGLTPLMSCARLAISLTVTEAGCCAPEPCWLCASFRHLALPMRSSGGSLPHLTSRAAICGGSSMARLLIGDDLNSRPPRPSGPPPGRPQACCC